MGALSNAEVGKYVNKYFVSSFQRVGTFKIVGKQKQGGNVAAYLCAPDGRVLHAVAGPVDARTMLKELKWTVETAEKAIKDARGDGAKFKAAFRTAHAKKLKDEYGLVVEAVTYDPPEADEKSALTYNDPSGRPLAPKLPPPPVEGPDVTLREGAMTKLQAAEAKADGVRPLVDRKGGRWVLGNQGRVHMLMAGHSMAGIERVYGSVFEGILGERVSTRPVEVNTPFPWTKKGGK